MAERAHDRLQPIGALGVTTYHLRDLWNDGGLRYLVEVLREHYPADHEVTVYEHRNYPVCPPLVQRTRLADLAACAINTHSTLWVPPAGKATVDEAMREVLLSIEGQLSMENPA